MNGSLMVFARRDFQNEGPDLATLKCNLRRLFDLIVPHCDFCLWQILLQKSFLGWRTKILRAADAFCARRREGPYRFIQNRSRTSVLALKSDAAAEKSKDQLSRDFPGRSLFDFCNNICRERTSLTPCSERPRFATIDGDRCTGDVRRRI
jgi:hypothetical protein